MSESSTTRRSILKVLSVGALAGVMAPWARADDPAPARARVILDNDFAGDPDGLFQLAHHLLSPSTEVRLILGSHSHAGEAWIPSPSELSSASKARQLLDLMGLSSRCSVMSGSGKALTRGERPAPSAASDAIIAEALRPDPRPLYYCAGAGLTDLATAWERDPRIGKRLTLVWIGGGEYPDLAPPPPGPATPEYNLTIDLVAAQTLFGRADLPIWQVPRSTYRQMLVSMAELDDRVRPSGPVGDWLVRQIEGIVEAARRMPEIGNLGETYILGDSPLVTLTSLQSSFQPDASSSRYVLRPCPDIDDHGAYVERPGARPIRVYTEIDTRLTFLDLYAKLRNARRT